MQSKTETQKLFKQYCRLVPFLVHKIGSPCNLSKEEQEDIIAEANISLWQACRNRSDESEQSFKAYIYIRIKGSIYDNLRKKRREYGKMLDLADQVKHLLKTRKTAEKPSSSYTELPLQSNSTNYIEDLEQKDLIRKILVYLSDDERLIISEHYLKDKKFAQIANENDYLSRSWISKLHKRALSKLREAMITTEAA